MDPQDFSEREPCRCSQICLVRARKLRARLLEQIAVSTLYIEHRFNRRVYMWLYLALEPEWAGETAHSQCSFPKEPERVPCGRDTRGHFRLRGFYLFIYFGYLIRAI